MKRRDFNLQLAMGSIGATALASGCELESKAKPKKSEKNSFQVTEELSQRMYVKALEITTRKVRGGDSEPFFKKPFVDAAYSDNIFLWDTCFIVCFAKYHLDTLPVYQALDNFYGVMDLDGYISKEYRKDGGTRWPKDHPVSINPPLLAFAETELYAIKKDKDRLRKVYPFLKKNFEYIVNHYQGEDKLFWGDTLGMGMDNIPRFPSGWTTDKGNGLTHKELDEKMDIMGIATRAERSKYFTGEYIHTHQGVWNQQGRLVDLTAQMALYALRLKSIAQEIGETTHIALYDSFHEELKEALNQKCWNNEDAYYYDLGYGKHIARKHIGSYWTLLGKLVPDNKLEPFLAHLTNPKEFYRKTPLPALSADDPDYSGWGNYWRGGVWAPTSYMVLKGLTVNGKDELALDLAKKTYSAVAEVFEATGTFWENYAPDLISYGMPAKKDFCGWTGLVPISIYKEYIETAK